MRIGRIDDTPEQISRIKDIKFSIDELLKISDEIKTLGKVEGEEPNQTYPNLELLTDFKNSIDFNVLNTISRYIDDITRVKNALTEILNLSNNESKLNAIYTDLSAIKEVESNLEKIKNFYDDFCYLLFQTKKEKEKTNGYLKQTDYLYNKKIAPLLVEAREIVNRLETELANSVQTIEAGHEDAKKLLTYNTVIKQCNLSYESAPFIVFDDENRTTTFTVPKPKPICIVNDKVIANLAQEEINGYIQDYLQNNPIVLIDEPITTGDLP